MSNFKSQTVRIDSSAEQVFNRLSDLNNLEALIARVPETQIPADKREMLEQIRITEDSISFPGGPVGNITLRMAEKVFPSKIRLEGENMPVALNMLMLIAPVSDTQCDATVEIDINIPPMLRPMVSGPLQKMADQFAVFLKALSFE